LVGRYQHLEQTCSFHLQGRRVNHATKLKYTYEGRREGGIREGKGKKEESTGGMEDRSQNFKHIIQIQWPSVPSFLHGLLLHHQYGESRFR
jgi:hypothetical protein